RAGERRWVHRREMRWRSPRRQAYGPLGTSPRVAFRRGRGHPRSAPPPPPFAAVELPGAANRDLLSHSPSPPCGVPPGRRLQLRSVRGRGSRGGVPLPGCRCPPLFHRGRRSSTGPAGDFPFRIRDIIRIIKSGRLHSSASVPLLVGGGGSARAFGSGGGSRWP